MRVDVVVCLFGGIVDHVLVFSGEDREKKALKALSKWAGKKFKTAEDVFNWQEGTMRDDKEGISWQETEVQ